VALFSPTWVDPAGSWIGTPKDPQLFIWYLGWVPHELAQGHNPLFTDFLSYPAGVNLMWNTSIVFPALVLWPVTALFGPVVAYNGMITAGIALSAWCAYLAARRFLDRRITCFVAGLVYGFSPALIAQALGHPHVVVALFPPIALLLGHEILVRRRVHPIVSGGLAGLAAALQLLTGEEMLAMTLLIAVIGVGLLALMRPDEAKAAFPHAARSTGVAVVVFAIIAAYPLAFQFFGPQRVYGSVQQPDVYVSDLLALVAPSQLIHFTGNITENGAYVGLPLLVLFIVGMVVGRAHAWVRWTAAATIVVGVLSLGPHLHVDGNVTQVPLPWALVAWLPLMGSALPARLMVIAFLGIGLIAGVAVAIGMKAMRPWRIATAVAMIAGLTAIVPWVPYPSQRAAVPAFFRPGGDVEKVTPGAVVLITPFSSKESTDAMYWQATAGYRFRMIEGDAFTPGPFLGPHPSFLKSVLDDLDAGKTVTPTADARARFVADLKQFGVTAMVVGPSPGHDAIVAFLTLVEGTPPVVDQGVEVWWPPLR
jgi:hypothetical protein